MCLAFFTVNHNIYKLALVFNREERTNRPTRMLDYFEEDPNILGGRDLESGGSWLSVNVQTGNVAFLTNYSALPKKEGTVSRGSLVYSFVSSEFYQSNIVALNDLKGCLRLG